MNLRNTVIYCFTSDGEFLKFDVSLEKKAIAPALVSNISQFKQE